MKGEEKEERYEQDMKDMGISEYKVIPIPEEDKYNYKVIPPSKGLKYSKQQKYIIWKRKIEAIEKMVIGLVIAGFGLYIMYLLITFMFT